MDRSAAGWAGTAGALVLLAAAVSAADWPQWRGPNRDGLAVLPSRAGWPRTLTRAWSVKVGSGHASPIVSGGRAFVFARQGGQEVAASFDLASGRPAWRQSYAAPYTINPAAASHGDGPKSTPVVSGGKLYTLGISGILSCFDAASGRMLWRKEFAGEFRATAPIYGAAMSPLVLAAAGGGTASALLLVHAGGQDDGALMALDADSGAPRWSWKGDGPGYASPVVAEIGGVRQVITQTQKLLVGVSAADGALLWKLPFTTAYDQNSVTPVVSGDVVIYTGYEQPLRGVRIVRRGAAWSAEPAWENVELPMYLSSPVLADGLLVGLSHRRKGRLFGVDARTGATRWTTEGRAGESAAVVIAGSTAFVLNTDAELTVARVDAKGFAPLATYTVADSATWAHPAVGPEGILVKDAETLSLWRIP